MKYFKLIGKYLWVFVGAVLFGIAAVKVKSAQRSENKAAEKVREYSEEMIEVTDEEINKRLEVFGDKQKKAKEARDNAMRKLDRISNNSSSVKSLLDEYNSNRM